MSFENDEWSTVHESVLSNRAVVSTKRHMNSSNSARLFNPPEELRSYGSNIASIVTEEVLDEGEVTPSHCVERSPHLRKEYTGVINKNK